MSSKRSKHYPRNDTDHHHRHDYIEVRRRYNNKQHYTAVFEVCHCGMARGIILELKRG